MCCDGNVINMKVNIDIKSFHHNSLHFCMNVTHLSINNFYNLQPLALGSTSYILYSSTDLLMNQKSMRQYCIPFYCIRYRVF